jgi:hypothetical protein
MKDEECMLCDCLKDGLSLFFSNTYIFVCYFIHHDKPNIFALVLYVMITI